MNFVTYFVAEFTITNFKKYLHSALIVIPIATATVLVCSFKLRGCNFLVTINHIIITITFIIRAVNFVKWLNYSINFINLAFKSSLISINC